MIQPHSWRECQPAFLRLDGQPDLNAELALAVETVWATLCERDRQVWHRVCCNNSHAPWDLTITARITATVRAHPTVVTPRS